MCDYQTFSQIFYILLGNIKLGPKNGSLEVQMGVSFELDLEKI